jgi:ketosteroid isomerase-like protein
MAAHITTTPDQDKDALLRLHREFLEANEPLDSGYLRTMCVEGADELVWFNLNQSNYYGLDHIAQLWDMLRAILAGQRGEISELRDERVEVEGDMALITYHLRYKGDFGNLGSFNTGARGTEVWRRRDGDWKLLHGHWSSHVPNQMGGF